MPEHGLAVVLPILFVLENNHIAQTTPDSLAIAGSIPARFEAFNIPTTHLDTSDVVEVQLAAKDLVQQVRRECSPRALVIDTARLGSHSKGDDTRDKNDVELLWTLRDPVNNCGILLQDRARFEINKKVDARLEAAYAAALSEEGGNE